MANDRVTQLPVEAIVLPTSAKARATTVAMEAVVLPNQVAKARTTQMAVEAIVQNITQTPRFHATIIS